MSGVYEYKQTESKKYGRRIMISKDEIDLELNFSDRKFSLQPSGSFLMSPQLFKLGLLLRVELRSFVRTLAT